LRTVKRADRQGKSRERSRLRTIFLPIRAFATSWMIWERNAMRLTLRTLGPLLAAGLLGGCLSFSSSNPPPPQHTTVVVPPSQPSSTGY
jgi:hypothetical protein